MSEPYDPHPLAPPPGAPPSSFGVPTGLPPRPPIAGARQPADLGMSGLGLIMQLAGTVFMGISGAFGMILLITMARLSGLGGRSDGTMTLWMLAMAATGVMRSIAHRSAGTRLLYDGALANGSALSGIKRYLMMSVIQIVVWVGFFAVKANAPSEVTMTLLIVLGAWPLALAIIFSMAQYKQLDQGIPMPEDKGFEGAAILMLVLGLTGLGYGLAMLYMILQLPGRFLSELEGILFLLILIMLVIRSCLHVMAGWRGVNEVHMDRAVESATRYADFGVITAFVGGGGLLLMMMKSGVMDVTFILFVSLFLILLLAWPLAIRKFFSERQFADILAGGEAPVHRRAPDLGHTTLGWLLFAVGVFTLSRTLPAAAILPDEMAGAMSRGGNMNPMAMMFSMLSVESLRSPWWLVGGAALQLWAGIELIRMTDGHRLVASIYGVVATAVAIYVNLPMFDAIKKEGLGGFFGGGGGPAGGIMQIAMVAISLIIPIGTLILVNRKADPTASVRHRAPGPGGVAPGQ